MTSHDEPSIDYAALLARIAAMTDEERAELRRQADIHYSRTLCRWVEQMAADDNAHRLTPTDPK